MGRLILVFILLGLGMGHGQEISSSVHEIGKKGFGAVTHLGQAERIKALRVSWFYSWGVDIPPDVPAGVEFIPMIWGWANGPKQDQLFRDLAEKKRNGTFHTLLGFNEPDGKDQANLPLQTALDKWPQMVGTGLRLGSPACVHPDAPWMLDFMHAADERHLRVDFITVHWYGDPNAAGFLRMLDRVHQLYGRPIWITEFAPADWKAGPDKPNRFTEKQVEQFMREVIPALNKLPYVERFAWFSDNPENPQLGISALFNKDGSLTPLGQIYAEF